MLQELNENIPGESTQHSDCPAHFKPSINNSNDCSYRLSAGAGLISKTKNWILRSIGKCSSIIIFLSASDYIDVSQALSLTNLVVAPITRSSGACFGGLTRICGGRINRLCVNSNAHLAGSLQNQLSS